ncbi:MAG: hypothetical protein K8I60_11520 [Anaerolineae bacterium]|nr:hypothetical protein [Anaerolineae bacterium]
MADDQFAFDQFPRGSLKWRYTRRELWATIKANAEVKYEESLGGTALTLAELGDWPDEHLAELVPMVTPHCQIEVRDGLVYGQPPNGNRVCMFPVDSPALEAFNGFNGLNLLIEVSHDLADVTGWDMAHSFAYTRGVFLTLVKAGICQPKYEMGD